MTDLKPCPFCGGTVLYEGWEFIDGFRFYCNGCAATIHLRPPEETFEKKTLKQIGKLAETEWNRRSYE